MSKQHKILRRAAATFLATAMMASLTAVPALATPGVTGTGSTGVTAITVTKTVTTDGNTYAPNTSFEIDVQTGAAGTFSDGENTIAAQAGIEGGLTKTEIKFSPNADSDTLAEYKETGYLAVDVNAFVKANADPGVYHYEVTETASTYEGIDSDETVYDVYLYLMRTEEDVLYVGYAVCQKQGESGGKADLAFTNDYGQENNTTHDVIITKNVEGTLANMSDTFSFDIKVNGADNEVYKVVYTQKGVPVTTHVSSGDVGITVSGIGDEDTIHIYGLSASDTYTVTEKNGVSQGYTVTDTVDGDGDGTVSGKVTVDGTVESITNTKDASTPTGIIRDIAPYALLVVAAAGACVIFLRKRTAE